MCNLVGNIGRGWSQLHRQTSPPSYLAYGAMLCLETIRDTYYFHDSYDNIFGYIINSSLTVRSRLQSNIAFKVSKKITYLKDNCLL